MGGELGAPALVGWSRFGYAIVAAVFVTFVVAQDFSARGVAFRVDRTFHSDFMAEFDLTLLPLLLLACMGRLPLDLIDLKLVPVGLWILRATQYALAKVETSNIVAAFHAVNAHSIYLFALLIAYQRGRLAAIQREGLR